MRSVWNSYWNSMNIFFHDTNKFPDIREYFIFGLLSVIIGKYCLSQIYETFLYFTSKFKYVAWQEQKKNNVKILWACMCFDYETKESEFTLYIERKCCKSLSWIFVVKIFICTILNVFVPGQISFPKLDILLSYFFFFKYNFKWIC